jgi:hypothetical protein
MVDLDDQMREMWCLLHYTTCSLKLSKLPFLKVGRVLVICYPSYLEFRVNEEL